ncbi:myomodulin neuropeptides-like [Saccostrea echinata]|uniref:myomodulin neuropeptides-like n=1 Tax=Saccostrea echinata TaxID=191078 RepID=UPI002A7FFA52|nr:myomodulin neuropeptides-like [Saccostrea echinata]
MKYSVHLILLLQFLQMVWGSTDSVDETHARVRRGGLSMLRLGRGLQMLRLGKRGMPMLRLGRSNGLSDTDEEDFMYPEETDLVDGRRQVPLPRYGKDLQQQLELNWLQSMFNNDLDNNGVRIIRPPGRPGRFRRSLKQDDSAEKDSQERTIPQPRIGRLLPSKFDGYYLTDSEVFTDKRGMPMLRLGRGMPMLRLGKRLQGDDSKRGMPMLRLGKRTNIQEDSASQNDLESNQNKRGMPMLRLGRNAN